MFLDNFSRNLEKSLSKELFLLQKRKAMMKMATYKIKLQDKEVNKLNTVDNKEVRTKLMSIYTYFVKHSIDNRLTKSIKKFHDMYKRYHGVKALTYFKKLVYRLVEMGLLIIEKNGVVNTYVLAFRVSTPASTKNVVESVETSSVKPVSENTEILNNKIYNTNTLYTTSDKEVVAPIELVYNAKKYLKEMKVKSKAIKEMVISKLRDCLNINRIGMVKYIKTVILEKIAIYKQDRANINSAFAKRHYAKVKSNSKQLAFTNYPQREYDYDTLEKQLLGWDQQ